MDSSPPLPRSGSADGSDDPSYLETLLAQVADVVFHAVDGRLVWVSASVEAVTGWKRAELLDRFEPAAVRLWHPDDRDGLASLWDQVHQGRTARGTFRLLTRDGRVLWVETTLRPHLDANGVAGAVGSLRDVTEPFTAQQILRESHERLLRALDQSGIATSALSPDGRFLKVNAATCAMLGRDAKALLALSWQDVTHPEDLDNQRQQLALVATGAQDSFRVATRFLKPDGTVVWGDLCVSAARAPGGGLDQLIGHVIDVTEAMRLRRVLEERESHYRMLAEHASDIIFRSTPEGHLQWISESVTRVLGWRREQLLGRPFSELLHPDDPQRMAPAAASADAGTSAPYEARFRTVAGEHRWMAVVTRPLTHHTGILVGRVGSARDIHREVLARERLVASERQYKLLADNISDVVIHLRGERIAWASPSITAALGGRREEWTGAKVRDVVHPDDHPVHEQMLQGVAEGRAVISRSRLRATGGRYHWVESHACQYLDEHGRPGGVLSSFRVIDDQVAAEDELQRRARLDQLTGLLNSTEVLCRARAVLGDERRSGTRTAVLFCDVDKFKAINDTLGHGAGDDALRMIAGRIRACTRDHDLAARMGGDEFMVVLSGVQGLESAVAIAEKIRASVSSSIPVGKRAVELTVSIGVTLAVPGESIDAIIERADAAMYGAKRGGRDQVVAIPGGPA